MTQQEETRLDALRSLALSQDLAEDTIRIALNIAGYEPHSMNQFERASAILGMAQELQALTSERDAQRIDSMWERLYTRTWEQTMKE